jgi:hypothetical protein
MSLSVPSYITDKVNAGEKIPPHVFIEIVQGSLPVFYGACKRLADQSHHEHATAPTEHLGALNPLEYGQVLRGMASTCIRREITAHFKVRFIMPEDRVLSAQSLDADLIVERLAIADVCRRFPKGISALEIVRRRLVEAQFATFAPPSMDTAQRIELLTLHAVESYRKTIEDAWQIDLAFQNCHASSGKGKDKGKGKLNTAFDEFCTIEAQLKNQFDGFQHC